jgi:TPR repeat protein
MGQNKREKSISKAIRHFAAAQSPEADFYLEVLRKLRNESAEDIRTQFLAAEDGSGRGWFAAAMQCQFTSERNFTYAQHSAKAGCVEGMTLYHLYYFGNTGGWLETDQEKGSQMRQQAADMGDPRAAFLVGEAYLHNRASGPDSNLSLKYFRMAAKAGYVDAMLSLIRISFSEGNMKECIFWSGKALAYSSNCASLVYILTTQMKREEETEDLRVALGRTLYYDVIETEKWAASTRNRPALDEFAHECVDVFCNFLEQRQKAVFTFLWVWQKETKGQAKELGRAMAEDLWREREMEYVSF